MTALEKRLLARVRELYGLVRWYRLGKPIKGVPTYLHGKEADKALAAAGRDIAAAEGREEEKP